MALIALRFCCSYHCCFISCTVTDGESQGPVSSQDVGSEEETVEKVHDHQVASCLLHQSVRLRNIFFMALCAPFTYLFLCSW